jgi:G:T-mismatch repair DNA endonuclease (very short patch repair protein)
MIKENEVQIKGHRTNFEYYHNLGYKIEYRKPILVKIEDLMPGTTSKITAICDVCSSESSCEYRFYFEYTKNLSGKYYCNKCNKIKSRQTCLDKYGVDNPMKNEHIKGKLRESILKKYGVEHYSKTDEYKEKYKNTCIQKYGLENAFQVEIFKDKSKKTSMSKYGVDYFINSDKTRNQFKLKKEENTKNKYRSYISEDFSIIRYESDTFLVNHKKCGETFSIGKKLFYSRNKQAVCICTICNPIGPQSSYLEEDISKLLENNNINYIKKDRKILDGLEIDIYLPEYKLAIEINGVYWHSELFKDKYYHLEKTKLCNQNNIDLIHIWEDDWRNKSDIIKSILLNRIGIINNKIYARNCKIKEVSSDVARFFLDNNHIQGFSSSSLKLGLYYNDELVSLMTFGYRYTNSKKEYELIRFCNKIGFSIVGASSKLFKYFLDNFDFNRVISYSDISIFRGGMYEKLNFKNISTSEPNYFWVVDGIRKHRFNYNKKKLVKDGFDRNKSEVEIMHERGYFRVWGCGQKKWEYEKM